MKHINLKQEEIDCCPLCQHDEYLISDNQEKFICGQCGFRTDNLQSVRKMIATHAVSISYKHTHSSAHNVH